MNLNNSSIKVALIGGDGRMGRILSKRIYDNDEFSLVGSFSESSSPNLGKDVNSLIGIAESGIQLTSSTYFENWLKTNKVDVVIDFSTPDSTAENVCNAIQLNVPCVIGTTGLSKELIQRIEFLCSQNQCSCVISSNMMKGVNIFFHLVEMIATFTKDWDVEIIEKHHRNKVDSPSGTALIIGQKIAKAYETDFNSVAIYGRKGNHVRKSNAAEIGMHSIRAGDIVGEHSVLFAGSGEHIEITHYAHNRDGFADGALTAAKFILCHQNEGKIFSMEQVLNL
ncbi:4-hydroxy-tetrahydrodipicolinate reductase [Candidatus Harpocratesius sp.]